MIDGSGSVSRSHSNDRGELDDEGLSIYDCYQHPFITDGNEV
jgi:hypothetical protein